MNDDEVFDTCADDELDAALEAALGILWIGPLKPLLRWLTSKATDFAC